MTRLEALERVAEAARRSYSVCRQFTVEAMEPDRSLGAALAALDALPPSDAPAGWQKIETAPKDGRLVDLWMLSSCGDRYRSYDCYWMGNRWAGLGGDIATHWLSVPSPPEDTK